MGALTRRQLIGTALGRSRPGAWFGQAAAGLTINPRSTWATDRPPRGTLGSEDVRFLIVHHSASRNGHTSAEAPGIIRSFYDYHTGPEKGWADIAYNFLIDAEGGVWEGRQGSVDGPVAGDATGGNQGYSQLVCVIGDYNLVEPTPASLVSLVALLSWLADRHGIETEPGAEVSFVSRGSNRWPAGTAVTTPTITGHRTMSLTTCPGDHLDSYVAGGLTADVTRARAAAGAAQSREETSPPDPVEQATPEAGDSTTRAADLTPVITTTTTTIPAPTPPPTRSPLLLVAGAVAAVATLAAIWRAGRMNRG